jgi:addiction module HigA family antidote
MIRRYRKKAISSIGVSLNEGPLPRLQAHPGEVLREEYLVPLGLSARALAKLLGVPSNRPTEIMRGTRDVSADTAIRLGRYFGTDPRFWLNLQAAHDLQEDRAAHGGVTATPVSQARCGILRAASQTPRPRFSSSSKATGAPALQRTVPRSAPRCAASGAQTSENAGEKFFSHSLSPSSRPRLSCWCPVR